MDLKRCGCGEIPERLVIEDAGQGGKYANALGSCCGEWMIEFRVNYEKLHGDEAMRLAVEAWNYARRAP
jgi:hypothetical protein